MPTLFGTSTMNQLTVKPHERQLLAQEWVGARVWG